MTKQAEQVAHAELVAGGQTALHSHVGGGGLGYTEDFSTIAVADINSWQDCDLSGLGVPPNAVCEVMIYNMSANLEHVGGARAKGSAHVRRVTLHEAEAGGFTFVTWHVPVDANSVIECWTDDLADLKFRLVGYWS